MVPVSVRVLAGLPLMLIVNLSAWDGLSLGVPSVRYGASGAPKPAGPRLNSPLRPGQ